MATTTPNRDYPVPESTDAVRVYSDMQALGNAIDTDVNGIIAAYLLPLTDTSVGTAASNFTASAQLARTTQNGRDIYLKLSIVTTNTLTPSGSDLTDVTIFTVDTPYRPTETVNATYDNDHVDGAVALNSDGTVVLRTASGAVTAGTGLTMCFRFLRV